MTDISTVLTSRSLVVLNKNRAFQFHTRLVTVSQPRFDTTRNDKDSIPCVSRETVRTAAHARLDRDQQQASQSFLLSIQSFCSLIEPSDCFLE